MQDIPLVEPRRWMPPRKVVDWYFSRSTDWGQYSNFGPCWIESAKRIQGITSRSAVPVSSGTAALQIAIRLVVGEKKYPVIGVPEFSFIATDIAAAASGRIAHLECDQQTWLPVVDAVEASKLDVLVIVAPFGYRCDFAFWDAWGKENETRIVYDLAGGWGMKFETENPCAISFHATKNLPIGEGGVVLCSPDEWVRAKQLSNFDFDDNRVPQSPHGINAKMDELHAATLLAQLDNRLEITNRVACKRLLIDAYLDALRDILVRHDLHHGNAAPSLCAARVSGGAFAAQRIVDIGREKGFVARRGYWPNLGGGHSLDDVICLPSDASAAEIDYVCNSIRKGL